MTELYTTFYDQNGHVILPTIKNTKVDGSGTWYVDGAAADLGGVSGFNTMKKFGRNVEIDSGVLADVWDGGYTVASGGESLIWLAPTAAAVHNIKSSSASDASVGVGARTIRIYGLKDWDTAQTTEDITLNGTTNVATANSYVIIHRMKVLTKGATNVNVGLITATATSPSNTTVTAQIEIGKGQTQMAIFGIPSTQTGYLGRFYANVNKAGGNAGLVDVTLLYNPEPDVEVVNFLTKHTFGLQTVGTSAFTIPYFMPKVFEGPGILKIQVLSGTNDMDVSAGFDVVLVNK